ncbi:SymE family type I addiction module toxin [Myroides sp. C15-4]|uniref:SymE family type I addiction module toxin n=1 Tax=Myroides sp. C15-4 TaxID=3400532 RepID=UPI003D2F7819
MPTKNQKQVKLHGRKRSCQASVTGNHQVPWLNVSGIWLEALGFHVGDTVRITTRDKLLIIEPIDEKEQAEEQAKQAVNEEIQRLQSRINTLKRKS